MLKGFRIKNQKGFASLTEVIITSVIFVIATAGIISTVSTLRPHAKESSRKVEAAHIGKGILDDLRTEVNAAQGGIFFGNNLSTGQPHTRTVTAANGNKYLVTYTISEPIPNVRKAEMSIDWTP